VPALLPAHPGLHTHRQALDGGAMLHGATVHFVTPEVDVGPIIAQAVVPVLVNGHPATVLNTYPVTARSTDGRQSAGEASHN